jgi:hypothetical protein
MIERKKNLRIHVVEEEAEIQITCIKKLFNENIVEISPNVKKDMDIQVQGTFRNQNRHDQKRTSPHYILVKIPKLQNKYY